MATTARGYEYEELAGSPEIDFTEQGNTAIRRFKVAWTDVKNFVSELAGQFTTTGNQTVFTGYVPFPDSFPTMICVGAKVKPFDDSAVGTSVTTLQSATNSYTNGALIEAKYRTLNILNQGGSNSSNGTADPPSPDGTYYTYEATYGAQYTTIPGKAWKWNATGVTLASTTPIGIVIPNIIHNLTWHRLPVSRLPIENWSAAVGTINSDVYRGYPTYSLLFVGLRMAEEFRLNDEKMFARVTFSFAEKRVPKNATLGGWNYFYNTVTNAWDLIVEVNGAHLTPYGFSAFSTLFNLL